VKLRFTPQAIEDITAIADYLRERNPHASLRVRAAILESLTILGSFPKAGRAQSTPGVRKFVTRRYAYLVYYTIDDARSELVILSVKHPARKPEHEND
jgi:plasmid stabilization system protein ParE